MQILIIGNGVAGTTVAQAIRQKDIQANITIFSQESLPYYARPRLPEFIAGKITDKKLTIFPKSWYAENKIDLKLNTKITQIFPEKKTITTKQGEAFNYDKLVLALGADATIPPIKMPPEKENILVERTFSDALKIKESAKNVKEIVIIGGGLLGLELANAFNDKSCKVKVIEIAPHLLPKQLNKQQGIQLQKKLEKREIQFFLDQKCQEIKFSNKEYIIITNQKNITGDLIILSSGATPRIDLATQSGIKTNSGILVNEYLETNLPDIYAAGDCIELNSKTWGFIKPAMEQGKVVAANIIESQSKSYKDTKLEVKLKVSDIDLKKL